MSLNLPGKLSQASAKSQPRRQCQMRFEVVLLTYMLLKIPELEDDLQLFLT